jgi:hypothetical protein
MTPFQDLPEAWQARIRALVEKAPPLTPRVRERLQMLLRQAKQGRDT